MLMRRMLWSSPAAASFSPVPLYESKVAGSCMRAARTPWLLACWNTCGHRHQFSAILCHAPGTSCVPFKAAQHLHVMPRNVRSLNSRPFMLWLLSCWERLLGEVMWCIEQPCSLFQCLFVLPLFQPRQDRLVNQKHHIGSRLLTHRVRALSNISADLYSFRKDCRVVVRSLPALVHQ